MLRLITQGASPGYPTEDTAGNSQKLEEIRITAFIRSGENSEHVLRFG